MASDRPPTRSKRFFKLAGMTASVAGGYAKSKVKTLFMSDEAAEHERQLSHLRSGGRIARTLGELKGAVMKLGQMASIASSVLPTELADALRALQREAPPMPYELIAEQIEAELGSPPEVLFRHFSREPFASASIGQVHRAVTDDGRQVVCKVQYPGVESAVDSDLTHLKLALRASGLARINKRALDESFEELRVRLHEELDYCLEADSVRLFHGFHRERHPFVVIPEVVGERSAQRVLTLTYEGGDPIHLLDARGYSQRERDRLGQNLLDLLASQIYEQRAIHGDPHPGNFAFRRDGTIVMYDFGCVKKLPDAVVQAYRDIAVAGIDEDYARVEEALIAIGARDLSGPPVPFAYYKVWRDIFAKPFLRDDVFDFGTSTGMRKRVAEQIPHAFKYMSSFQPAKDIIILNRAIAGHYSNLRTLRARVPVLRTLRAYWDALE